jgi:transposase-like protein
MGSPRCPSCRKPFHEHLGLTGTCAALKDAKKQVKYLEKAYQKAIEERDAARKINKMHMDKLMGGVMK